MIPIFPRLADCDIGERVDNLPPAVIMSTMMTSALYAPPESPRKERNGKHITIQKHQIGTPLLVVCARNFGARPSSARPYRLRTAQYVYVLPAEKIDVNINLSDIR